jgi:hypothetical protein
LQEQPVIYLHLLQHLLLLLLLQKREPDSLVYGLMGQYRL